MQEICICLENIFGKDNFLQNEPLKNYTSFKIGGAAKYFVSPQDESQIVSVLKYAKENNIPCLIIGNGSNLLISDKGYNGIVIHIGSKMSKVYIDGDFLVAEAGATLSKTANAALKNSLSGMEFASGIPGTIGGALYMNAGAYGGEMKDIVYSTKFIDDEGNIKEIYGHEHEFGYRKSVFSKGGVIISTKLKLQKGDFDKIKATMADFNNRRKEKQPLEYPSAGSTFKRPEGYFAGKLIEDANLKGYSVGGAKVSEKHCGFVINYNNATCEDVLNLINDVQKIVYNKFNVKLETEVKYIGE